MFTLLSHVKMAAVKKPYLNWQLVCVIMSNNGTAYFDRDDVVQNSDLEMLLNYNSTLTCFKVAKLHDFSIYFSEFKDFVSYFKLTLTLNKFVL